MNTPDGMRKGWETRRANMDARFWDGADRSSGPESCWPWLGKRQTGGGYGTFVRRGVTIYAHRRALELSIGRDLAADEHALHRCDNPPCINPAHLFVGTNADNIRDRDAKGRRLAERTWSCPDCGIDIRRVAAGTGARCDSCAAQATRKKRRRAYVASRPSCMAQRVTA